MTQIETYYLALVIGAMAVFAITLAITAHRVSGSH
jgi:hypothetical protein